MGKIEKVRVLRNDRREGKKVPFLALLRWCVLVVFLIGVISVVKGMKSLFGLLVPKDAGHRGGRNGGSSSQWARSKQKEVSAGAQPGPSPWDGATHF